MTAISTTSFNRRTFFITAAACTAAVVSGAHAQQAATAKVQEFDSQAVSLGYKDNTTRVDEKKFPKHTKDQRCASCQLFLAKPTDPMGPCALFGGKQVSAIGWCNSWVKRPA